MSANSSDTAVLERKSATEAPRTEPVAATPPSALEDGVTQDFAKYANAKPSMIEYMRHAQRKSGRKAFDLVREYLRLYRGRGKLTFQEYVQFGLYDTQRYSAEQKSRFLSLNLHWPITHICCDMTWQATTESKWLCGHILAHSGIKIPETLAVIDKTDRCYIKTHKISSAAQLRDFATANGNDAFFCKEKRGTCSFGAFLVEAADSTGLSLRGVGHVSYEDVMEKSVGTRPYLLQRLQRNHSFFDSYTTNLATIRVCILNGSKGVQIPFCILKLPSSKNIADSFWRPGNLACNLDVVTGRIMDVRSKDPLGTTSHAVHPETGANIIGEYLPMWGQVLNLARNCALIFKPIRYQSMDIAITPEGPVLIEINTGGGFDLPQLGSGEGFLTDEVCEFFRSCGYTKI